MSPIRQLSLSLSREKKKRNFRWALADEVILTGRRASSVERMARKSMSGRGVNGRAGNAGKARGRKSRSARQERFVRYRVSPIKKRFLR